MSREIEVRTLAEHEFDAWNAMVEKSSEGSLYATPDYLSTLCRATGGTFKIVAALRGEEIVGGVPLYEQRAPAGIVVHNRLLLYYNGLVLREYDTRYPSERMSRRLAAMEALAEHLGETRYAKLALYNRALLDVRSFQSKGWEARPSYSYVVELDDLSSAWGRVVQNLRRLIGRAEQHGVVCTDEDDFDAFFGLHRMVHERKEAPLYLPYAAFREYFLSLRARDLCRIFLARLSDGTPAAGQLVLLGRHPVTHTVCAGADAQSLSLGTTPFLRWKAFERLAALGYRGNDLTDAALNDITRFKSQFGGTLVTSMVVARPSNQGRRERVMQMSRRVRTGALAVARGLVGWAVANS
jgi:hypothetical protein